MRRPVWIGVGVAFALALLVYAYNVSRNASARARVDAACQATEAHADGMIETTREWLTLLSEEPGELEALLRRAVTGPCDAVRDELVWWQWGWGRQLTVDMDPGGELHAAGRDLAERCPGVMRQAALESSFFRDHVDELVAGVCSGLEEAMAVPQDGTTNTFALWDWADELEAREEMLRPSP